MSSALEAAGRCTSRCRSVLLLDAKQLGHALPGQGAGLPEVLQGPVFANQLAGAGLDGTTLGRLRIRFSSASAHSRSFSTRRTAA
jgi:hypothetical protein